MRVFRHSNDWKSGVLEFQWLEMGRLRITPLFMTAGLRGRVLERGVAAAIPAVVRQGAHFDPIPPFAELCPVLHLCTVTHLFLYIGDRTSLWMTRSWLVWDASLMRRCHLGTRSGRGSSLHKWL